MNSSNFGEPLSSQNVQQRQEPLWSGGVDQWNGQEGPLRKTLRICFGVAKEAGGRGDPGCVWGLPSRKLDRRPDLKEKTVSVEIFNRQLKMRDEPWPQQASQRESR